MCGIVGYVGSKNAPPILLDGLKRLEYRGYDSAGIAVAGKTGWRSRDARASFAASRRPSLKNRSPARPA